MPLSKEKYRRIRKKLIENKGLEWIIDLSSDDNSSNNANFINSLLGTNMTAEEAIEFCKSHDIHTDIDLLNYLVEQEEYL